MQLKEQAISSFESSESEELTHSLFTIKEMFEKIKKGDENARKTIIERYKSQFIDTELMKSVPKKERDTLIEKIIDSIVETNYYDSIPDKIRRRIQWMNETGNYDCSLYNVMRKDNSKIIESAKKGDKESKELLIKKYQFLYKNSKLTKDMQEENYNKMISEIVSEMLEEENVSSITNYILRRIKWVYDSGAQDYEQYKKTAKSIEEMQERAIQGDIEYKNKLIEYYTEMYKYFIDENKEIPNIEQIYENFIKEIIEYSISIKYKDKFSKRIKYRLNQSKKYNGLKLNIEREKPVFKLIQDAKTGDKERRNEAILYYMHIIDDIPDLTDDEKQEGYIILIKYIDSFISNTSQDYFTYNMTRIKYELESLKKHNKEYLESNILTEQIDEDQQEEFILQNEDFEIYDIVENLDCSDRLKIILKKIMHGETYEDIAKEMGTRKQNITQLVTTKTLRKKIFKALK